MRAYFFTVFIFSALLFLSSDPAFSQNGTLSELFPVPLSDQESTVTDSDTEFGTENTADEREQNIFATATDQQIKEAQQFYDICNDNETMREKKDCKCAATSYLETRINLGEAATTQQIMDANINTCLKDEARAIIEGENPDLSKITDEQLEESQAVYEHCKASPDISRQYDCECFAAKFLDERLEIGPLQDWDMIFLRLRSSCRNIVETTGFEYSRCMRRFGKRPPPGIESVDFCECYAREWAREFENFTGDITNDGMDNMRFRARSICKKPDSYN